MRNPHVKTTKLRWVDGFGHQTHYQHEAGELGPEVGQKSSMSNETAFSRPVAKVHKRLVALSKVW